MVRTNIQSKASRPARDSAKVLTSGIRAAASRLHALSNYIVVVLVVAEASVVGRVRVAGACALIVLQARLLPSGWKVSCVLNEERR